MRCELDNDLALEMLMDRLEYWTDDPDEIDLYRKMYENYIDGGVFESNFHPMEIVDNDYNNWCTTISSEDENFEQLLELYQNGERDISCEDFGYSYIEAVSDDEDLMLVRC